MRDKVGSLVLKMPSGIVINPGAAVGIGQATLERFVPWRVLSHWAAYGSTVESGA